jgi:iron complex outermembrane receptor protein
VLTATATQTTMAQSLEELVVTARKTEESLQDVPISITAFGAEQLQEMGVTNNEGVALMTVNFSNISQIGRRLDRPVVRGMSSPATFGEPNASYFVDGAYVSGTISTATIGPVERVEVLRGPQSAQFGRATFSGAINYVTRKPTNELTGELLVRGGNNDSAFVSGWASGPIIKDKLMFFGSLSFDQFGGEWENTLQENQAGQTTLFVDPPQQADSTKTGETDTRQAVGKLLWNITDTADLTFKLGYVKGDDGHYAQLHVGTDELNCYVAGGDGPTDPQPGDRNYTTSPGQYCGVIDPKNRQNILNIPDLEEGMTSTLSQEPGDGWESQGGDVGAQSEQINALLQYDQDINDWMLTARAAWNRNQLDALYDLDGTSERPFVGLFHLFEDQLREDSSAELRIASPIEYKVRGSLGVYYYDFEETARQSGNVGLQQGNLSAPTLQTTKNTAIFGSFDWDLMETLTFTTEARYAKDTKEITSPESCDDPDNKYFDPDNPIQHEESTTALTPRFTLRYSGWDNAMTYVQAAKGNKPGAFNRAIYSANRNGCQMQEFYFGDGEPELAFVDEENAWTYEIGGKTSWFNNRVIANLAVFYIDWDNLTTFETANIQIGSFSVPQSLGINAGKADVKGLELETTFAITDRLIAAFSYGYNDAKYTEYTSSNLADTTGEGLTEDGEFIEGSNNAKGNQVPNSPKHNVVTSLSYNDQFTSTLGWFGRTDFVYESKKYTSGTNFEQIGERKVWNARTGLEHDIWRLSAYVNNILDEQTPTAIIGFPRLTEDTAAPGLVYPNGYALTPMPGRQYGLELLWRFGN